MKIAAAPGSMGLLRFYAYPHRGAADAHGQGRACYVGSRYTTMVTTVVISGGWLPASACSMIIAMDFLTPFIPGETVPKDGSYWVRHLAHRAPYLAVVSARERLPHCSHCKVVFEYASDATYGAIGLRTDGDLYPAKKMWPL